MTRVLIVSRGAKQVTEEVQRTLDAAFPGYAHIDFDPSHDVRSLLSSHAVVVVAGGDGTVGFMARALAGSRRRLGILPLGTFNNFANALAIPPSLDRAIAVVRAGATRPVTLGRVNGRYFLEAAAIGIFGEGSASSVRSSAPSSRRSPSPSPSAVHSPPTGAADPLCSRIRPQPAHACPLAAAHPPTPSSN
jgi:hypothetical protein